VLALAAVAYFVLSRHFLTFHPSMTQVAAIRSLAVLPLQNLSGNQADEYFSDGITDELITDLARIAPLRVTSRTSVMQFKGTKTSLPEIGRKLRVDAVVEGSVVRIGDRVRVTAQLIETATDRHIWANNFEESSSDILTLQDELARAIAQAIQLELGPTQRARLSQRHQINPEAYDDYLRGRFFWNARTEESLAKAQDYFQKSLAKDPLFAPAYSGLADVFVYRGYYWGRHLPPREAMPLARAAALKAIQLDGNSAEGHTSLAMVKFLYDWNFREGEQEFRRAILLNPSYPTAHHFLAINLVALGHHDEAIAEARKAVEADPLSVPVNNILGETLAETGHIDEACAQYRKTLELDPNNPLVLGNITGCYLAKNQPEKAFEERVKLLNAVGVAAKDIEGVRKVYKEWGWPGICKLDLQFSLARWNKDHWHVDAYSIASNYANLGQMDRAFEWYNKCLELRSGTMTWLYLGNDPMLLKLRADPRFAEIKRRMEAPAN
jgi:TolB-like protein/Tfp pilus assembly protein PilF